MLKRSPAVIERLAQVAQAARVAGHGGKAAVYAQARAELGMSASTLHRALGEVAPRPERKRRSDRGRLSLSHDEALTLSAALMASLRKQNTKRLLGVGKALEMLRSNGELRAERLDAATGELVPLSNSAVLRALRNYGLHPDQLLQPAPAVDLKSLHSNHVWQIDASLCVLYYLNADSAAEAGLQVMEVDKFYKNKPANLKRIAADRVWSYEVTDHRSGSLFLDYAMGAETGLNLAESFINAVVQRPDDPFHGVPRILMMDMGAANTGSMFMNLLRRLQVEPVPHKPGNARATGQVENARNIIERQFESALRFQPVSSLAELRAQAWRWARWFNATALHSRHGLTRTACWLRDLGDADLRVVEADDPHALLRGLLTHNPQPRKVNDRLRVGLDGRQYDVRAVPDVMVGERLQVALNPYDRDSVVVVQTGTNGHEVLHRAPLVRTDDAGFAEDANVIGQDYRRPPVTLADTNRAAVAMRAMGVDTAGQARAARAAKALPFGGRIDPFKPMSDTAAPTFLPRRGTPLVVKAILAIGAQTEAAMSVFQTATALARRGVRNAAPGAATTEANPAAWPTAQRLSVEEACMRLRGMLGSAYTAQVFAAMKAEFGAHGVPADALPALRLRFADDASAEPRLRAGGGQ